MELRNLNIWLRAASDSGDDCCPGSLKKWLWRPGKERGKDSDRESRGCAGGVGRGGRGSKPQNWDVILLRARLLVGWPPGGPEPVSDENAGCDGHPGYPRDDDTGDVLVRGSSSDPLSSLLLSLSPLVLMSSGSGLPGPSISSSESESLSCGSDDLLSPPKPDLSSPNPYPCPLKQNKTFKAKFMIYFIYINAILRHPVHKSKWQMESHTDFFVESYHFSGCQ